ncbi:MAG: carbohydrate kinase family protein [Leucobacter sp.]
MNQTASPSHAALIIGEALFDIIEHETSVGGDAEAEEHIGGSPANVAVGTSRLGHTTRLLTWIGRDDRGEQLATHFQSEGVELLSESWGAARTPTALAHIAPDGAATYTFDIDWQINAFDAGDVALVHAGSIALYLEPGGTEVLRALREHSDNALITLDPNIRPTLLPDGPAALRRFEDCAAAADLVKLSDEDAAWLYPDLTPEAAATHVRSLGPTVVVVTLGADGALATNPAGTVRVSAKPVTVVDTISAGDSFMASLISSLLERGIDLEIEELENVLDRAARAAAIAVSVAGANPPYRSDLEN